MASILPHTSQPGLKNSYYLVDKSTKISREDDKLLLGEIYYGELHKGDYKKYMEIPFTLDL